MQKNKISLEKIVIAGAPIYYAIGRAAILVCLMAFFSAVFHHDLFTRENAGFILGSFLAYIELGMIKSTR